MKKVVMLIGFGGPRSSKEVRPFLESVLRGVQIPPARFDEVMRHYEVIGGISPYNSITYKQKEALEKEFLKRGVDLPIFVGFRHSIPSLADTLKNLKKLGSKKVIAFILASLRSRASFEKYVERVEEAKKETGTEGLEFVYTEAFHKNPLFVEAQAEEVSKITQTVKPQDLDKTFFIFSAHSIPVSMALESGYDKQFEKTSALIAQKLNLPSWCVAYQSRSGNPRDHWLEPSVEKIIQGLDRSKSKNVVLVSAGFLCDNVEVIYDLDHECKALCEKLGLKYFRARTVMDHPKFIEMVADLIMESLRGTK